MVGVSVLYYRFYKPFWCFMSYFFILVSVIFSLFDTESLPQLFSILKRIADYKSYAYTW